MPTAGEETTQTGAGSSTELELHTEDAFHPHRADRFMLLGLRNPDSVGTIIAPIAEATKRLPSAAIEQLLQPGAPILPDSSYTTDTAGTSSPNTTTPQSPAMTALWSRPRGHGLRYDPACTPHTSGNKAWWNAYEQLTQALQAVAKPVALYPGDLLIVDNDACVHGRAPFTARYDGADRWLLRIDIRSQRTIRPASEEKEHGYG